MAWSFFDGGPKGMLGLSKAGGILQKQQFTSNTVELWLTLTLRDYCTDRSGSKRKRLMLPTRCQPVAGDLFESVAGRPRCLPFATSGTAVSPWRRRQAEDGIPSIFLKARLKAASDP
jgi:hypothetical protein